MAKKPASLARYNMKQLLILVFLGLLVCVLPPCRDGSDDGKNDLLEGAPPVNGVGEGFVSPYYTPGIDPDVAIADNGTVVQVHDSGSGCLWYKVGRVRGPIVVWGKGYDYDDGKQPSIAFTGDSIIVEVHRSSSDNGLWYHVGKVQLTSDANVGEVDWGPSVQFDNTTPDDPAVAIYGTTVVVVYSSDGSLHYQIGALNVQDQNQGQNTNGTITWNSPKYYATGATPDVAINETTVVEVHKGRTENSLWCRVGQISPQNDGTIKWGKGFQYDTGTHPSVGLLRDGTTLVETHTAGGSTDTLWGRVGVLNGSEIAWQASYKLADYLGEKYLPTSVAVRNCGLKEPVMAIITTTVVGGKKYLRDELAFVLDGQDGQRIQLTQERWMELSPWMHNVPFRQLRLIGSHDAASDGITKNSQRCIGYYRTKHDKDPDLSERPGESDLGGARCQSQSMLTQLRAGVRYFDLRVAYQRGKFYSEHIWLAGPFEGEEGAPGILDMILRFLKESPGEVIVLHTSSDHMYSDKNGDGEPNAGGIAIKNQRNLYFDMLLRNLPGMLALAPVFSMGANASDKSKAVLDMQLRDVVDSGGRIIYFGLSDGEVDDAYQKYIWPLQNDGIWHKNAKNLEILYDGYDGNDDGDYNDYDYSNNDTSDDIDEMGLNKEVSEWIKYDGNSPTDKLHVMQAMTNGGSMGKIDMAAVVNPKILEWLLSDWKEAQISVVQVNDAVNTPDWVRIFLLNWMWDEYPSLTHDIGSIRLEEAQYNLARTVLTDDAVEQAISAAVSSGALVRRATVAELLDEAVSGGSKLFYQSSSSCSKAREVLQKLESVVPVTAWCWPKTEQESDEEMSECEWAPQGITSSDDASGDGEYAEMLPDGSTRRSQAVLISWFGKNNVEHKGVRISFIKQQPQNEAASDLPFIHVLLATPVIDQHGDLDFKAVLYDGPEFELPEHDAGGIAWYGNNLYVTAGNGGVHAFDLGQIYKVHMMDETSFLGRKDGKLYGTGYRYVILERWRTRQVGVDGNPLICNRYPQSHADGLCFSSLSLDRSVEPSALVTAEYRKEDWLNESKVDARIVRWDLDGSGDLAVAPDGLVKSNGVFLTSTRQIQGAVVADGFFYISTTFDGGTFYSDKPGDGFPPLAMPWLSGGEGLSFWSAGQRLWSLTEKTGTRMVLSVDACDMSRRCR